MTSVTNVMQIIANLENLDVKPVAVYQKVVRIISLIVLRILVNVIASRMLMAKGVTDAGLVISTLTKKMNLDAPLVFVMDILQNVDWTTLDL